MSSGMAMGKTASDFELASDYYTEVESQILRMIQANFVKGFPTTQWPGSGKLWIHPDSLELSVEFSANCQSHMCPRMITQPLNVSAPIVETVDVPCGTIIKAMKEPSHPNERKIEIQMSRQDPNICRFIMPPKTEVKYISYAVGSSTTIETEAEFIFRP